jgi:hypothetical protein
MSDKKFYKKEDWGILESSLFGSPDDWVYVDSNDKPITGILENFKYFKEGDPRNNVFIKEGKR